MNKNFKILLFVFFTGVIILPFSASAAGTPDFYYGGWIPFWNKIQGAVEATNNLQIIDEISPFSYEIKPTGVLIDKMKINEGFWPVWLPALRNANIQVTPSIAWFDGSGLHKLLSNSKTRTTHINQIVAEVKKQKFSGVDIDFENKKPETAKYYSQFIKELGIKLYYLGKTLSCTVEPRTPVDSLSASSLKNSYIKSSQTTDYAVLNKYCDAVRVMAYDQGILDTKLNATKGTDQYYAPVADPEWVEKVLNETLKSISPDKIMLGIPTYGYEYQVSQSADGKINYKRLRALNYKPAMALAASLNITPQRNSAGELSFVYQKPAQTATKNLVWFSDAIAIVEKINLAKKLKLRGVFFFKLDGGIDPSLWDKIK